MVTVGVVLVDANGRVDEAGSPDDCATLTGPSPLAQITMLPLRLTGLDAEITAPLTPSVTAKIPGE